MECFPFIFLLRSSLIRIINLFAVLRIFHFGCRSFGVVVGPGHHDDHTKERKKQSGDKFYRLENENEKIPSVLELEMEEINKNTEKMLNKI